MLEKASDVIVIQGLEKKYGSIQALFGVNLRVQRGEILGFLGPNGAGKTTTIRCMLDHIRPQAGSIRIFGINPQVHPNQIQERTGYLPGELRLEDNYSVKQQLRYFGNLRKKQLEWTRVEELTERLDLDLSRAIKNLSSGNKQKVGIVQALMHQPDLLLLDEPTSGLDPLMQQEVYGLLHEAQQAGVTVFFSSHIISEVETLADRIAIIRKGVIVEESSPEQLTDMAVRRVKVRFHGPVDVTPFSQIPGVELITKPHGHTLTLRVEGDLDPLIKKLADFPVRDLETSVHSLEDIFLRYYRSDQEQVSHVG